MKLVITGAASGIGRAMAALAPSSKFFDTPVELLLVDRDGPGLKTFADELDAQGVRAATFVADLSNPDSVEAIIAEAGAKLGGLDGLLSNAGAIHMTKFQDMTLAEYDRIFSINGRATFLLGKAAYPLLKASKGAIVATASMASNHPSAGLGAYSASKAATAMLIRQMALEWGPDGIRANCISPGPTMTAMTAKSYSDSSKREQRASEIPLRRIGEPEDLANAALFLVSKYASYITGVNLVIDGGLSLTTMVSNASAATNMDNR